MHNLNNRAPLAQLDRATAFMQNNIKNQGALLWNIRKLVSKGDYIYAIVPEHPCANKHGYVLLHRIIMENHLGRILDNNEVVHHIDGDKKHNIIENLQLMTAAEHARLHAQKGRKMIMLKCPECGKEFAREKRQTHLGKGRGIYTCCSVTCKGKFSRNIQLHGITEQVKSAISGNILFEFNSKDNPEGTHSQETP